MSEQQSVLPSRSRVASAKVKYLALIGVQRDIRGPSYKRSSGANDCRPHASGSIGISFWVSKDPAPLHFHRNSDVR